MIFDTINKLIADIKKVRRLEVQKSNLEQQKNIDFRFHVVVEQTSRFTEALCYAKEELNFVIPDSCNEDLKSLLAQLERTADTGLARKEAVQSAEESFKALRLTVQNEWSSHFTSYTAAAYSTLHVLSGISVKTVSECLKNLKEAESWPEKVDTLKRMKEALQKATELVHSLNMDQDIVLFLSKMSSGEATLSDLNEKVFSWIKNEKLGQKIKLSFLLG